MATFKGNWLDTLKHPFDPNAVAIIPSTGGGKAQVARHARRPSPALAAAAAAARTIARELWDTLTPEDKPLWKQNWPVASYNRDGSQQPWLHGWLAFSRVNFAPAFHRTATWRLDPSTPNWLVSHFTLDQLNPAAATVRVNYTVTQANPPFEIIRLWIMAVNPHRPPPPVQWIWTHPIYLDTGPWSDGATYHRTLAFPWPIPTAVPISVMARNQTGAGMQQTLYASATWNP
jgi:hypothetical protein